MARQRQPLSPGKAICLILVIFAGLTACASSQSSATSRLDEQRKLFRTAVEDVKAGRLDQATQAIALLEDYVLIPYLELQLFKARIYDLTPADADLYFNRYDDAIAGTYMKQAWLIRLKNNKEWDTFLHYANGKAPRGMHCAYIEALRARERNVEANKETSALWQTGHSLPDRCDNVLNQWLAGLSPDEAQNMYWLRVKLAIREGQSGLAKYLLRNIPGTENLQELLAKPEQLYRQGFQLEVNDFNRELVLHTLKRLAAVDFESSNTLWHQLDRRFTFSAKQNYALRDSFAREAIAAGEGYARDWLNANDRNFEDPYLTEWRVRLALKDGDWKAAQFFINALPPELRNKSDWQYWQARTDIELRQGMTAETKTTLQQLASERGYYSFLSADLLNLDYQLGAKRSLNPDLIEGIAQRPGVQRARELFWHGLVRNAYTEWRDATRNLNQQEQVAAAQMALDWGWSHAAVATAIRAREWDDLELRFPLAFKDTFADNAKARNIDLNWAYAIARQESAFAEHAQSRVGARGVMQLMPSTARDISRKMGRPYPTLEDLHTPQANIEMGSFYLGHLLEEFGGNHILATAAYNAGPARVKRVLARQKEAIPADIWIENLPYGETREYIKNVLAFSVVYGLKLGNCKSLSVQSTCNTGNDNRYSVISPALLADTEDATGS